MILHRRASDAWVFAVDHDAVQVTWRALRPGRLRIEVLGGATTLIAPSELDVVPAGARPTDGDAPRADAGAATIEGLPPGRLVTVRFSGPAIGATVERAARTLASPPGGELFRLATISDLHLGARAFGHRGTIRDLDGGDEGAPWRCGAAAIDEAARWGAQRLVVKGDITNAGLVDQWRSYARLIGAAPMPVDAIAGNHDTGRYGGDRSLTPADAAAAFGFALALPTAVRDVPGLRIVLADTTVTDRSSGTVRSIQDEVVEAAADAPRDQGVLVVLHHHLHPHALPEGPPRGVDRGESRGFVERLGAVHPNVVVTSGHSHRNRRWGRAGVVVTQVSATQDYPGVWAGYRVHEGGLSQIVRRIESPSCAGWTDRTRRAGLGLWEHLSPGRLDARCFEVPWAEVRDRPPRTRASRERPRP